MTGERSLAKTIAAGVNRRGCYQFSRDGSEDDATGTQSRDVINAVVDTVNTILVQIWPCLSTVVLVKIGLLCILLSCPVLSCPALSVFFTLTAKRRWCKFVSI